MATLVERIQTLDFAAIDDTLGRVRTAVAADGTLDLSALDVDVLLGDLAPVIAAVRQLDESADGIGELAGVALRELGELTTLRELAELAELAAGLEALGELIADLVGVLRASDGGAIVDRLMSEVGGSLNLAGFVGDIAQRAAEALRVELPEPLGGVAQKLGRLGAGVPSPDVLADTLLGTLAGLDFAAVRRLGTSLSSAIEVAAVAGDHRSVAAAFSELEIELDLAIELSARAGAGGEDLERFVAALESLGARVDAVVTGELARFAEGFATDLRTCRNRLLEVDPVAGLEDLLGQIPRPGIQPLEMIVEPMRDLAGGLDAVTAESLSRAFDTARGELTAFVRVGELAASLDGLDKAERRVIAAIRSLPAERVRETLVSALRDVQREILSFSGFGFLDEAVAPVRGLVNSIDSLDTSAVTGAITEVVDRINASFADFPIEDLRDAVEAVTEPLGAIIDEARPVLEQIVGELETLTAELDAIDFDAAGAQVVEELAKIRDQITAALESDAVPEALQVVISGAAATLKRLDLTVELSDPFDEAMARIDVDAVLEPIDRLWDTLRGALLRATPAALIEELDPPFEELLARVDDVSLAPLTASLSDLFGDLVGTLRRADPRELLAPLDAEYQRILDRVRATLDPAPLFAPVRGVYDELLEELESIDLEAAIREMLGGISDAPKLLSQAVEGELARGSSAVSLPSAPEGRPFRFGDPLRPLAALVAEIRSRLHGLVDTAAAEGLGQLADATRTLRRQLDASSGFVVELAERLDERRGWFDREVAGPYAELSARLAGLDGAVARLELDAAARARVDAASGAGFRARFTLDASLTAGAADSVAETQRAAEPPGFSRSARLLVRELDRLLPSALLDDDVDPRTAPTAFIDAVLDAVDPTPLADELDAIGDEIMAKLAEFVDELSVGLVGIWNELIAGLEPLMPTSVAARLQALIDAVAAEFRELDPVVLEDEAREIVEATIGLLSLYSPARLAGELGTVFDAAIAKVEALDPGALLGDLDPFAELKAELETSRPSVVLAPLLARTAALKEALEAIAAIDLDILGELVARITAAFKVVLDGVEREWSALLDELEGLGGGSAVGSVSVASG